MDSNGIVNTLKKSLNEIYQDFRSRIDADRWKSLIDGYYAKDPEETAVQVTEFMLSHPYVPVKVLQTVCGAIDLRNRPSMLSDIYSCGKINRLLDGCDKKDIIRYSYISPDFSEEIIDYLIDTAEQLTEYLDRGQIYLADRALEGLRKYCPTHPDVLTLQKKFTYVRSTGGVETFKNEDEKLWEEVTVDIDGLEEDSVIETSVQQLEEIIREDYRSYGAYYPLGCLYIKQGEKEKADSVADTLMDACVEKSAACLLKGLVMEAEGRSEDAFFYYERACRFREHSQEAEKNRDRLWSLFDPEPLNLSPLPEDRSENHYLDRESAQAVETAEKTDYLIRRGRLTEAYYELVKATRELKDSELLRFKKAYSLYLMKKAPEAREIFAAFDENSPLYRNASYILKDIDCCIAESGSFDGIAPPVLAEIFYNTGRYQDALAVYANIPETEFTAGMMARKGRCQLETGNLKSALQSFTEATQKDFGVKHVWEYMGLIYQSAGKASQALDMYEEALRLLPENAGISELKASVLFEMGENERLLEFRNIMEENGLPPSDADGYAGLVHINGYPRNEEKGIRCLERAVASGTDYLEFYVTAVNIHMQKSRYLRALRLIEKGLEVMPDSEELYMKKAEILHLCGKTDAAYINAGMLLTEKPDSPEIQYLMGCISSERGDDREALKWFKSAAALDSESYKYAYAVADKCFETGDMSGALSFYTDALRLNSDDYISYKHRALIYSMRDENDKAVSDLKRALELRPEDPEIYLIAGDLISGTGSNVDMDLEGRGQADLSGTEDAAPDDGPSAAEAASEDSEKDAEYYYSMAISVNPLYRQAYISRARYYTDVRRLDEALADIEKAVELDDKAEDAYMMRGIIHHVRGENESAIKDFETASASEKFTLQACSYISKCCNALGNHEGAVKAADRGLEIDDSFLNLYINRGVALYNLERYHQAVEDFRRVIQRKNEINTAAVEAAYRYRGMTNDRLGEKEAALNDYRMLLRYSPDNSDVKIRISEIESELGTSEKKHRFPFLGRKHGRKDRG